MRPGFPPTPAPAPQPTLCTCMLACCLHRYYAASMCGSACAGASHPPLHALIARKMASKDRVRVPGLRAHLCTRSPAHIYAHVCLLVVGIGTMRHLCAAVRVHG